ncbi:hypothetical protein Z583_01786 [Mycobacterium tuberculosis variant bovis Bz 31150]|nr:hypothetical protein Z583_01786 [Mycobacterium tuberculosis variant bovis Bz 31150]
MADSVVRIGLVLPDVMGTYGDGGHGVEHTLVHDTVAAIASCPPGRVEVVANYTAFLQLQRALARRG